mmetsp:Transcript_37810/g.119188  ORF Transcript_37810/g.119188 Transcript_37810/m.119188 type:complete len:211 (+) Transcript_37810:232-864(+)
MLLAAEPLAGVGPAIGPGEVALALLPIVGIRALVAAAVRPLHPAQAAHLALVPLPLIHAAISKGVGSLTLHGIVGKLPSKGRTIGRGEDAKAVLLPSTVVALEVRSVHPGLQAVTRFHVVAPFTLIGGSVPMEELAPAMRAVLEPLTVVQVAVGMHKPPDTMSPVFAELPVIASTVGPDDYAVAVPTLTEPLPSVGRAALQVHRAPIFEA